jgi:dienelactone hydrolase
MRLLMRFCCLALFVGIWLPAYWVAAEPLPGTEPLTLEGDIAAQLVAGVDKFLSRKIDESAAVRDKAWPKEFESSEKQAEFLKAKRERLAKMLGVRDERVPFDAPELVATARRSALIAEGETYKVYAVRWPTVRDMFAEGLWVEPNDSKKTRANLVVLPDADQTPEQILGLVDGAPEKMQFARMLAEGNCRLLIPTLISRQVAARNGRAKMTNREYIYRSAFELGRHVIGYELQEVFAAVDWFARDGNDAKTTIGVVGNGEGGMLAMYAAALDPRIRKVAISGYFGKKEAVWRQPVDRNVFGILTESGNAEVLRLLRGGVDIYLDNVAYPKVVLPGEGGAPGTLEPVSVDEAEAEYSRIFRNDEKTPAFRLLEQKQEELINLAGFFLSDDKRKPTPPQKVRIVNPLPDADARQKRLLHAMDRHNQWLLLESPYVRAQFMKGLDTSSREAYAKSVEPYRETFKREVIGWFDDERLPPKPRSRQIIDKEKYVGYEVVLDVWPDVIAYGILLLPKDIKPGERRPVVVCQHGLEGRPQDVVQGDHYAYHDFAAKLAERGFITLAPQNLYIGQDKFRTLQRKANPLGKTLFSVIIPQHQQIVDWLKTLPQVDPERIAFYGLSYGGKSAMRIPPLVPDYCLSICSADFNDWVWKNASTRSLYSYVWTGEYEIFEWDLGSTFNYAEMAALIAPRPFMVERGHADGVAPDETVAYEFAKVFNLYNARLKLGDRCEIEFFDGPHTINGQGTFRFLHKHLRWPEPKP